MGDFFTTVSPQTVRLLKSFRAVYILLILRTWRAVITSRTRMIAGLWLTSGDIVRYTVVSFGTLLAG